MCHYRSNFWAINVKQWAYTLLFFVGLAAPAYAQEQQKIPFLSDQPSIKVTTLDYKTSQQIAQINISITKEMTPNENNYIITQTGQGQIETFDLAAWHIESTVRDNNGFLETLNSVCKIMDLKGNPLLIYKKTFDYERNTVHWESYDKDGQLKNKKSFSIKGKICDDTTLMFFLKAFMPTLENKQQTFYLLTNEPKLFKTNIKWVSTEKFMLKDQEITAAKIKLTADIGIIDDLLDKFVAHTYMWYNTTPPYNWLKYQGFQKDAQSNYIINILDKTAPSK